MLSLSEAGLRLWKSDESIAALLQSWIRFLLQSPKAGAADTLGCETCPVRMWISPKATEVMLFCENSLTGEYSGTRSSLDTGLQWQVFWYITGTGNILSMWLADLLELTWHPWTEPHPRDHLHRRSLPPVAQGIWLETEMLPLVD